jgi:small subunit ribosomal protein S16
MKGAQPTDTVKAMLSYRGILLRKHLQIGVLKGAITQESADSKLADWLKNKESSVEAKREKLTQTKEEKAKARKAAETKVREARAEAIRKKSQVVEAAPAAEEAGEGVPAEQSGGEAQA